MIENLRTQRKKRTYCWLNSMCTLASKFWVGSAMTRSSGHPPLMPKVPWFSSCTEIWKAGVESVANGVPLERKPLEGAWKPKTCAGIGTARSMVKNCFPMPSALDEL